MEELIDLLIAESRKDDKKLDWADVKKRLLTRSLMSCGTAEERMTS